MPRIPEVSRLTMMGSSRMEESPDALHAMAQAGLAATMQLSADASGKRLNVSEASRAGSTDSDASLQQQQQVPSMKKSV